MVFDDLTPEACYQAMKSHDVRFDGHFFVGVRSTRIYCRPICRVRLPKQANCSFHRNAAAAEVAGFRPCLRCRPELAPGVGASEASSNLARSAAQMIEDSVAGRLNVADIARRIGITDRHLRRIFTREFGVSPVQFAQTQRLLLAKRLLSDTSLPVAEVATSSGFSSIRRMNALFAERYQFSPTRLRQSTKPDRAPLGTARSESNRRRSNAPMTQSASGAGSMRFLLPYRPPFDFTSLLAFLRDRAIPGIESVEEQCYRRTVPIEQSGWIEVRHCPARNALELRCDAAFAGVTQSLLSRTKQAFDLGADSIDIDAVLGPMAATSPGMRLPGTFDPFELAVRAILGQQVTVKAARTLATRFVAALGTPISTPFADLNRVFPRVAHIASLNPTAIAALGIVRQRAEAIVALAAAIAAGAIDFRPTAEPTQTIERLCQIRGIGPWTAHYIAMRALAWPDAWLPNDIALQHALGLPNTAAGARTAQALADAWRPWRSYAVLHLWRGPLQ